MLRPSRRPSHSSGADDPYTSPLDLGYGNTSIPVAAPSYYNTTGYATPAVGLGGGYADSAATASPNTSAAGDGYSTYKDKPGRRHGRGSGGDAMNVILSILKQQWPYIALITIAFVGKSLHYRSTVNSLLEHLHASSLREASTVVQKLHTSKLQLERDYSKTKREEQTSTQKYMDLKRSQTVIEHEREDLARKLKAAEDYAAKLRDEHEAASPSATTTSLTSAKELAYVELVHSLQMSVQRESRRAVLEKFGAPPYRVDLTVALPSDLTKPRTFRIELAPLDYMPHAVHLFLEQVAHGLWNGHTFFYVNGPHVVQCGPQATVPEGEHWTPEEERHKAVAAFRELQLETLAFPEYSADYPHLPWTLGFTGRPGGPDWYINKVRYVPTDVHDELMVLFSYLI
jgi:hypothetical protein